MGPGSKMKNIDRTSEVLGFGKEESKMGKNRGQNLNSLLEANISDIDLEIEEPDDTIGFI